MRRWITKLEWRDKRRAEGFWRDVQVKDAHDIFDWLETNPDVHRWVTARVCDPGGSLRQAPPAQLPPDVPGFVGRHDELQDMLPATTSLGQANIVVLTGQPGVGKTALAVHFAHRRRADFPDGQIYVDLRGMQEDAADPRAVVASLLRALGAQDSEIDCSTDEQLALYRTLCHDKELLVILDNAADERQVRPIVASGAGCLTVVTSRHSLNGLDGVRRVPVGLLPPRTALDMLAEITSAERVSAQHSSAELICRLCGFLPLALRIAGVLAVKRRGWSLEDLARRLSDECRRLDQLKVGDVAVRASFQLSYDRLAPATRSVFRRIPLVPGPDFNVALLSHAMEPGLRVSLDDELELLAELNLVGYGSRDGRYRIHDLLRLYAEENLQAHDTGDAVKAARDSILNHLLGNATRSSVALQPGTNLYQPGEPLRQALTWLDDNMPMCSQHTHWPSNARTTKPSSSPVWR